MTNPNVLPFLKWAGGKRWLARSSLFPTPARYGRYVEPFLGGAAVFFHLGPRKAILSDVNRDLIQLYVVMRDEPHKLRVEMEQHQRQHSAKHYYEVRARVPDEEVKAAARTLYLNRTCWNGLYRVNRRGEFNVPIGTKSLVVSADEDFNEYSSMLKRAKLLVADFEETIDICVEGDFLFVDPPYTVRHNKNGFLKYNESMFSWDDQLRLHRALKRAAARRVKIVVTNADHESLRSLYERGFRYDKLDRSSVLAGDSSARGTTSEAMFTANLEGL